MGERWRVRLWGQLPPSGSAGAGMVLVKNWHFGAKGTIKNYADMNANFVYHDQFNTIGNGTNYGAVTVAPDAANALPNQPIEGADSPPVRQFTADSLKTLLTPLRGADEGHSHAAQCGQRVVHGKMEAAQWRRAAGAGHRLGNTRPLRHSALLLVCYVDGRQQVEQRRGAGSGGEFWIRQWRRQHQLRWALLARERGGGKDTTDYGNWGKAMSSHGIASYDASKYHIWTWLYQKDNSYAMYVDGVLVQSGSNYYWTYGSKETDPPIDMVFLFDGGWGHTQIASVNHPLPASAFTGKFYEWNYSRVYLSRETSK